jgi:hypothetical protein
MMSVLHEAHGLVHADRGADYGHPLDNFGHTAGLWKAAFGWDATPEKVAMAMILVKVSRECHKPKRDNRTDICGYAETLQMVHDERQRRSQPLFTDYPVQTFR